MAVIKDAYETTTGCVAVREEDGSVWVLKQTYLDGSMSHNQKLERAIDLFKKDKRDAFEKYSGKLHGLLHVQLKCISAWAENGEVGNDNQRFNELGGSA